MVSDRIAGLVLAVCGGYMLTIDFIVAGLLFVGAYMWSRGDMFGPEETKK